ncbi:class I SAM-dependent methyltransferase [Cesiribacter andamanensis]|uniref:3-demethylubiquinone-9 3-methyltransferase n=1 Tax=Cesiribacter andamanensis AMV16 TaxID=1279009 RepID=M7NBT8_9BACT|nr:class I SAM-dependent methyltransferase [Cesiribacter andamanensis]EMR04712.1 3-demethylubiquinone-9 3-methyltransferase [Cesiribacter andamanensis AMV16]
MLTEPLNQEKAEAFSERLIRMFNEASAGFLLSIGHRTGLLDVLATLPPSTSQAIANKTSLNERYVREWLNGLVTAHIVLYHPHDASYWLPPEHAAFLTRKASPNNMAAFMQYLSMMGEVEDKVIAAFSHGKGVPYSAFTHFHELMAEESAQTVLPALEDHILPLIPGMPKKLETGARVMDVGCGRGLAMLKLARRFPNSRFLGRDIAERPIADANEDARRQQLPNVSFEQMDAAALQDEAQFDLITAFDAIHDQPRPAQVLAGIHRALKPDGYFLMQDISGSSHVEEDMNHPIGTALYTISLMHCMSVSLAADGPGLGAMWGKETALKMLSEAGFGEVVVHELPHDFQNFFYVAQK